MSGQCPGLEEHSLVGIRVHRIMLAESFSSRYPCLSYPPLTTTTFLSPTSCSSHLRSTDHVALLSPGVPSLQLIKDRDQLVRLLFKGAGIPEGLRSTSFVDIWKWFIVPCRSNTLGIMGTYDPHYFSLSFPGNRHNPEQFNSSLPF